jgi:predicted transcriptional regulator
MPIKEIYSKFKTPEEMEAFISQLREFAKTRAEEEQAQKELDKEVNELASLASDAIVRIIDIKINDENIKESFKAVFSAENIINLIEEVGETVSDFENNLGSLGRLFLI